MKHFIAMLTLLLLPATNAWAAPRNVILLDKDSIVVKDSLEKGKKKPEKK